VVIGRRIIVVRARYLVLLTAIAGILLAGSPGVRPRATATDYPAHQSTNSFTIGAALIPRSDVRKIFAADLNRAGYIVVEVGVFPLPGQEVDLSPGDFMLLTDAGKVATRSVDADSIAGVITREHSGSRPGPSESPSDVYVTAGASISRIPVVDPATGRQTHATVVGTEEGVGTGRPVGYPAPTAGPNPGAIERELWTKSLPDGKTAVAVAGYLYFPKPAGKTASVWELMFEGVAGRIKLTLQRN
jgi:hypothetical protein